jgi:hypothetical protein
MQIERSSEALELVIIVAHWGARLEPGGLGSRTAWALVDLNKVNHAGLIVPWLTKTSDYLGSHQIKKENQVDDSHERSWWLMKAEQHVATEAHGAKDRA